MELKATPSPSSPLTADQIKTRPISFKDTMVKAILDGSKSQTRRLVGGVFGDKQGFGPFLCNGKKGRLYYFTEQRDLELFTKTECPYGVPGDRLWVKEGFSFEEDGSVIYKADGPLFQRRYKSSRFMPRWASRITLEVTEVRVQRLWEITEADAQAEGISELTKDGSLYKYGVGEPSESWKWQDWKYTATEAYRHLWEQINGPGSWMVNPWIWAISFKVVTP